MTMQDAATGTPYTNSNGRSRRRSGCCPVVAPADRRPDGRDDAACRDADPELFFPDGDIRSARARVQTANLICRACPVSATCLSWALASGQEAGIWGGLTEDERRRLRHRGHGSRPAADSLSEGRS